jgi:hypothetical protein
MTDDSLLALARGELDRAGLLMRDYRPSMPISQWERAVGFATFVRFGQLAAALA